MYLQPQDLAYMDRVMLLADSSDEDIWQRIQAAGFAAINPAIPSCSHHNIEVDVEAFDSDIQSLDDYEIAMETPRQSCTILSWFQ